MSSETLCDDHLPKGASGVCTGAGSFQEKNSSNPTRVCSHRRNLGSKYRYGSKGEAIGEEQRTSRRMEAGRCNTNKA